MGGGRRQWHGVLTERRGAALKRTIQAEQSQRGVWNAVAETEAQVATYVSAPSPSLSASGTYSAIVDNETLKAKRADYVETLLPQVVAHDDAIGVVVAIDGELVGADVYGSHELFQKLVRKVLDSYAQESILAGESPSGEAPELDDVKRFLAEGDSGRIRDKAAGDQASQRHPSVLCDLPVAFSAGARDGAGRGARVGGGGSAHTDCASDAYREAREKAG